jgi:hypothetical protein
MRQVGNPVLGSPVFGARGSAAIDVCNRRYSLCRADALG